MIIQSDFILNLCTSVLALLKQYVCLFELKEPVIHKLHDEQMQLFKNVLVLFIQPEKLSSASARDLTTLNLDANLLKESVMFVGSTLPTKDKTSKAEFLKLASRAYITCGKHLQAMLPLNNELLKVMSATDPLAHGHSVFLARLKRLPKAVGVSLTTEDRRSYEKETSNYQVDNKLPATIDSNGKVV